MKPSALIGILFGLGLIATCSGLPTTLIIGGEDAAQGELTYQVRLEHSELGNICGGALVESNGKQFVLTGGDCMTIPNPERFLSVVAGDLIISETSGREQIRRVTEFFIAEDYNYYNRRGNIAIVKYDYPFNTTDDVKPVGLPYQDQDTTGEIIVSGWGATKAEDDPLIHDHLQKLKTNVVSDEDCAARYENSTGYIRPVPSMICADSGTGRSAYCYGDMGGPAVSVGGGYLAGITTYPLEYCYKHTTGYPDLYTEVSHYVDWINSVTQTF